MSNQDREPKGRHFAADGSMEGDAESPSVASPLEDAELQERYRQEYLLQLRRLACPGCGEAPFED